MVSPKPILDHIRAFLVCALFLGVGCGWSWMFPFSTLDFVRVSPDRVDCHVNQRMLGVISFKRIDVEGVQRVSLGREAVDAQSRTTGSAHYLYLNDARGDDTLVNASAFSDHSVKQINEFLKDANQSELQLWSMSVFGYATALIALPGLLLLAVIWDMIVNRIAWLTHGSQPVIAEDDVISDINPTDGTV